MLSRDTFTNNFIIDIIRQKIVSYYSAYRIEDSTVATYLNILFQVTVRASYIGPAKSSLKSIGPYVGDRKLPLLEVVAL